MMYPTDAARLAFTKLKTRRIRLSITLIISSLLFMVLIGASFVARGAITSLQKFSNTGFANRYFVSGLSVGASDLFPKFSDPNLIAQAQALQKQTIAAKTAEAKKLGITYDPATDPPYVQHYGSGPGQGTVNVQLPAIQTLLATALKGTAGFSQFQQTVNPYGDLHAYTSIGLANGGFLAPPYLTVLQNGKEDFGQGTGQNYVQTGLSSLPTNWQLMSRQLMTPFILPGQNLAIGRDGSIPVIAPYSAVEQLLGLKSLPGSATAADRLARLKEVRAKAAGITFSVCYRNATSASDVQTAVQLQQQITQNKGDKNYQLPELVQDVPATACGPVRITRDVRTADEKAQAAKQQQFDQDFGKPAAQSAILTLRVVGLNTDPNDGPATSVTQIAQSLLQSSLGVGWFSPLEAADTNPTLKTIFTLANPVLDPLLNRTYYAELSSAQGVKQLIDQKSCIPSFPNGPPDPNFDSTAVCMKQQKYFTFQAYGSNSTALEDLKKGFAKIFTLVAAGVALLASIIMMATVGRIIADSRRETAVFRAIGAKRADIAQIYLTYTVLVALLIAGMSLVIGLVAAQIVQNHFAPAFTVNALVAFNVPDLTQQFALKTFYAKDIFYVCGLILVASLLSAALPLLLNVRRNPINDMRDER